MKRPPGVIDAILVDETSPLGLLMVVRGADGVTRLGWYAVSRSRHNMWRRVRVLSGPHPSRESALVIGASA